MIKRNKGIFMSDDNNKIDPHFKIRNSPLQGDEAYRSPFYRRLLSAGYKGYLQGSLGGATLFAGLGLLAGGALAVAGTFLSIPIATGFIAIPIMAGAGLIYGKDAFGTIGAMAAISSEQAELNEKRRGLLDRYYETPSAEEAKEIEKLLIEQGNEKTPKKWFHWQTGLLGAAVVASVAVIALSMLPQLSILSAGGTVATALAEAGVISLAGSKVSLLAGVGTYTVAAAIGGLIGAVAGVDRSYIRKWFDVQENLHDDTSISERKREHQKSVDRLSQAYKHEGFTAEYRKEPKDPNEMRINDGEKPISPRALAPINNEPTAQSKNDSPTHHVEQVMHEKMLQSETKYLAQL